MIPFKWEDVLLKPQEDAIIGDVTVRYSYGTIPIALYGIGVDPGRNFGLAIFNGKGLHVFNGKFKQYFANERWMYGIEARKVTENLKNIVFTGKNKPIKIDKIGRGAVEGAAFKKQKGQVNLAEVRFGFVIGLYDLGLDVTIVPPSTARAQVAGRGTIDMNEFWPTLNGNAADAIGIAAYAAGVRRDDK